MKQANIFRKKGSGRRLAAIGALLPLALCAWLANPAGAAESSSRNSWQQAVPQANATDPQSATLEAEKRFEQTEKERQAAAAPARKEDKPSPRADAKKEGENAAQLARQRVEAMEQAMHGSPETGYSGTWTEPGTGDIITSVIAPRPAPSTNQYQNYPIIIEPQVSGSDWSGGSWNSAYNSSWPQWPGYPGNPGYPVEPPAGGSSQPWPGPSGGFHPPMGPMSPPDAPPPFPPGYRPLRPGSPPFPGQAGGINPLPPTGIPGSPGFNPNPPMGGPTNPLPPQGIPGTPGFNPNPPPGGPSNPLPPQGIPGSPGFNPNPPPGGPSNPLPPMGIPGSPGFNPNPPPGPPHGFPGMPGFNPGTSPSGMPSSGNIPGWRPFPVGPANPGLQPGFGPLPSGPAPGMRQQGIPQSHHGGRFHGNHFGRHG